MFKLALAVALFCFVAFGDTVTEPCLTYGGSPRANFMDDVCALDSNQGWLWFDHEREWDAPYTLLAAGVAIPLAVGSSEYQPYTVDPVTFALTPSGAPFDAGWYAGGPSADPVADMRADTWFAPAADDQTLDQQVVAMVNAGNYPGADPPADSLAEPLADPPSDPVPESGSFWLAGIGLMGLAIHRAFRVVK